MNTNELFKTLNGFTQLTADDMDGAEPPSEKSIATAKKLVKHMCVVPTVDGGVCLEWLLDSKISVALRINCDGDIDRGYVIKTYSRNSVDYSLHTQFDTLFRYPKRKKK